VAEHAIEFSLLPPLGRSLQLGRPRLQPSGDEEYLLDQRIALAGGVRLKTSEQSLHGKCCGHDSEKAFRFRVDLDDSESL
jgi:hypothetical protein